MKAGRNRRSPQRLGRPKVKDRPPGYTRARLVEAASDVFAEDGFSGASIQTIAARADVTSAAIYRHFDGKADLLLSVLEAHGRSQMEQLTSGADDSLELFSKIVSTNADPGFQRGRRLAVEVNAAASRDADAFELLREYCAETQSELSRRLKDCVEAGLLPTGLDVPRTAVLLRIMSMGLAHLDTLQPDLIGDRRWTRFLEASVVRLLTS